MTGPEHYREAERLLDVDFFTEFAPQALAAAQAHATLALVAAQIEAVAARGPGDVDKSWTDVVWPTSATDEGTGQ